MNKQVIAFLSLFSLVLVLSVYYVLVPVGTKEAAAAHVGYQEARQAFFTALEIQKEARQLEYIDSQSLVIVSTDATDQEKAVASVNIDSVRQIMQIEEAASSQIKGLDIAASYVEVKAGGTMIVISVDGDITNRHYNGIFKVCAENSLLSPVIYNYDNPPSWLINDLV